MKTVIKIISPVLMLCISLVIFNLWTLNYSYFTIYSYVLSNAGSIPYKVSNIALTNQFGNHIVLDNLSDKYTLVNFIYLNCPHTCPISVLKIRNIIFYSDRTMLKDLHFLSVSFDQENDNIKKIKLFWELQGSPDCWDIAILDNNINLLHDKLLKLGLWVKKNRLGEYNHTSFFFLINNVGEVIEVFTQEQKIINIIKKIKKILLK